MQKEDAAKKGLKEEEHISKMPYNNIKNVIFLELNFHLTSYNNRIECQSVLKIENPCFASLSDKKALNNLMHVVGRYF